MRFLQVWWVVAVDWKAWLEWLGGLMGVSIYLQL